eukprot:COSAG01_NODE_587_length_15149_cov_13.592558_9_plen_205_part_00
MCELGPYSCTDTDKNQQCACPNYRYAAAAAVPNSAAAAAVRTATWPVPWGPSVWQPPAQAAPPPPSPLKPRCSTVHTAGSAKITPVREYAAKALSAESPQQSAVVAYSGDFGLEGGLDEGGKIRIRPPCSSPELPTLVAPSSPAPLQLAPLVSRGCGGDAPAPTTHPRHPSAPALGWPHKWPLTTALAPWLTTVLTIGPLWRAR